MEWEGKGKILFNISEFFLCGEIMAVIFFTPLFFNHKTFCEYPFVYAILFVLTVFFGGIHFYFQAKAKYINLRRLNIKTAICWVVFFIVFFVNWIFTENLEPERNRALFVFFPAILVFYCYLAGSPNLEKFFIYHILINTLVVYLIITYQVIVFKAVYYQVSRAYVGTLLPLSMMFFFFCYYYTQKTFYNKIHIFLLVWLALFFSCMSQITQVTFLGICIMSFVWSSGYYFFKFGTCGKLLICMLMIGLGVTVNHHLKNCSLNRKIKERIGNHNKCPFLLKEARKLTIDKGFEKFDNVQQALYLAADRDIRKAYVIYGIAFLLCTPFDFGIGVGNFPYGMGYLTTLVLSGGLWLLLPIILAFLFTLFSKTSNFMALRLFFVLCWLIWSLAVANLEVLTTFALLITLINYDTFNADDNVM
ncbi:MAG: hypothetical protein LBD69_04325 [Puniceicoccales bacterium]|nr:hypothetical protein [Puniceicoccales bacterium]